MFSAIVHHRVQRPKADPETLMLEDDDPIVVEWLSKMDPTPYKDSSGPIRFGDRGCICVGYNVPENIS